LTAISTSAFGLRLVSSFPNQPQQLLSGNQFDNPTVDQQSVSRRQRQLGKLHLHLLLVTQLPPSPLSHTPNTTIIALTPAKHHSSATSQHLSLATSSHHNYFIFAVIVALGRNK
jgi:hypothetical protein